MLSRTDAYIGILIDDLVTKGTDEPYRIFTSRAEFRLHLRIDNADRRLMPLAHTLGTIADADWNRFLQWSEERSRILNLLKQRKPDLSSPVYRAMRSAPAGRRTLDSILRRPEVSIDDIRPEIPPGAAPALKPAHWKAIETEVKYAGYLQQQQRQMERLKRAEARRIPADFAYRGLPGLSREVVEKMERVKPQTLGQAGRIPGITPAAIAVINLHLGR